MSAPCPTFGFVVTLTLQSPTASERRIVDDFHNLLERHGLEAIRAEHSMTLTVSREGGQATHHDREIVREWSNQWAEVASITIGDLVDLQQEP